VPIIILAFVQDEKRALIVIACFTLGFSSILAVLTDSKNHEVLAATAA
jgi:hypothetical protein